MRHLPEAGHPERGKDGERAGPRCHSRRCRGHHGQGEGPEAAQSRHLAFLCAAGEVLLAERVHL